MLNKYCLLLSALFILICSCKNDSSVKQTTAEKTISSKIVDNSNSQLHKNKALVLTHNLDLYNGEYVKTGSLNGFYGTIIDIDSISKKRMALNKSADRCDEHNFVYSSSPRVKGWIYGADVFEYLHDKRDTTFTIEATQFKVYATKNFAIGASDENGLTSCSDNSPIVLYNSKYKVESYVPMIESADYKSKYMVLDASDAWYDEIKATKLTDDLLTVAIRRTYQEGSADIIIDIKLLKDGYSGEVVGITKFDE
jgi:hypothetical protein